MTKKQRVQQKLKEVEEFAKYYLINGKRYNREPFKSSYKNEVCCLGCGTAPNEYHQLGCQLEEALGCKIHKFIVYCTCSHRSGEEL